MKFFMMTDSTSEIRKKLNLKVLKSTQDTMAEVRQLLFTGGPRLVRHLFLSIFV